MIKRFDALQIPHQLGVVILISVLSAVGMLTLAFSQAGCHNLCSETAPARGAATLLVADAQTSLAQASIVVSRIPNQGMREKALIALDAALAALRASEKALHGVESACTSPDIASIFADFVAAWKILAPFLSLLGGPAGSQVATPLVVLQQ